MKLSCCDHSFPLLTHAQVFSLVRLLEFDAVNVALWGGSSHVRPGAVQSAPGLWADRVSQLASRHSLAVADVFLIPSADYSAMAVNHPLDAERASGRELFADVLGFVARLGADGITILPGVEFEGVDHELSMRRAAEELTRRVELARNMSLRVSVEPHIGSVISNPDDVIRLLDMAPGLDVTLDYSHVVMQDHPQDVLDPVLGRVRHMHARGARSGRLQVGLRHNTIDFDRAVERLRRAGYSGALAVEYLHIAASRCDEDDVLSETVLMRDLLTSLTQRHGFATPEADRRAAAPDLHTYDDRMPGIA